MNIKTREIEEKDIHEVYMMFESLYSHLKEKGFILQLNKEDIIKEIIESFINSKFGKIILLLDDEKIIGFTALNISKINMKFVSNSEKYIGNIIELFIYKDYRGKKLGKILLNEADKYFTKNSTKIIQVNTMFNNIGAIDFYKNNGFKEDYVSFIKNI